MASPIRRSLTWVRVGVGLICLRIPLCLGAAGEDAPRLDSRLIFAPETWHVHASCLVELPNGDLLACWFHGSGERTADDVKIQGARFRRGAAAWGARFTMADTPGFPDCNPTMVVDPRGRLWLFWAAILSNQWESALLKYQVSSEATGDGPPRWSGSGVVPLKPPPEFQTAALAYYDQAETEALHADVAPADRSKIGEYYRTVRARAADRLAQRLGWMPRAHPLVLGGTRLLVPLYSDGFDFSLMALSDDWGDTWRTSTPLLGAGNIQPSVVCRRDGTLYTLMRDNGPAPKRLHQSESRDRGETWARVSDSAIPNPGSGAEVIALRNGHWALISNDTESGRYRLTVQISDDEGRTWRWRRALEEDPPGPAAGRYHYPSIIEGRDGTLHATYSHHVRPKAGESVSANAKELKSIKHVRFNEAWVHEQRGPTSR